MKSSVFIPSHRLIAIGLERFLLPIHQHLETNLSYMRTDLKAACDRIVNHKLIVGKTSRRLFDWVKLNRSNDVYNPIQYFFEFNRAPPIIHEIHEYSSAYGITLKDRVDELPINWKDFSTAVSNFNFKFNRHFLSHTKPANFTLVYFCFILYFYYFS